jgi:hypothetical protein
VKERDVPYKPYKVQFVTKSPGLKTKPPSPILVNGSHTFRLTVKGATIKVSLTPNDTTDDFPNLTITFETP